MLYLSTVLPTVSYIIAIIILWQQQPCIRIRFVLSIILFIFLLMILCRLPAPSLRERAGGEAVVLFVFIFLSATCEASSHEIKNACQTSRLAHVSFSECKGTKFLPLPKSHVLGIRIPQLWYVIKKSLLTSALYIFFSVKTFHAL